MDRIRTYEAAAKRAFEQERYWDHAYVEGYLAPLYIMVDDRPNDNGELHLLFETAPFYFMYSADADSMMQTEDEFRDAVKASSKRAPKQRMAARECLANLPEDMIMFHDPFLPELGDENQYAENEHA